MEIFKRNKAKDTTQTVGEPKVTIGKAAAGSNAAAGKAAVRSAAAGKAETGKEEWADEYCDKGEIMIKAQKNQETQNGNTPAEGTEGEDGFESNYSVGYVYSARINAGRPYERSYSYLSFPVVSKIPLKLGFPKSLKEEVETKRYERLYFLDWQTGRFFVDNKEDRFAHGNSNKYVEYLHMDQVYTVKDQSTAICILSDSILISDEPKIFGLLPAHFFTPENRVALENLAKKNIEYCGAVNKDPEEKLKERYKELRQIYRAKCAECDAIPEANKKEAEDKKLAEIAAIAKKKADEEEIINKRQEVKAVISKWDDEMQSTK